MCKPAQKIRQVGQENIPQWIPPPRGFIKVNVDVALSKNTSLAALAAVAHDDGGNFLDASVVVMEGLTDPEIVEALACREALGSYGRIMREIKGRKRDFTSVEFVHEKRSSNVDTHVLARSSRYSSIGKHMWFLTPTHGVCNSHTC
ncbi:hypothetical protein EJB05_22650, partial [Eragrostis curvula]